MHLSGMMMDGTSRSGARGGGGMAPMALGRAAASADRRADRGDGEEYDVDQLGEDLVDGAYPPTDDDFGGLADEDDTDAEAAGYDDRGGARTDSFSPYNPALPFPTSGAGGANPNAAGNGAATRSGVGGELPAPNPVPRRAHTLGPARASHHQREQQQQRQQSWDASLGSHRAAGDASGGSSSNANAVAGAAGNIQGGGAVAPVDFPRQLGSGATSNTRSPVSPDDAAALSPLASIASPSSSLSSAGVGGAAPSASGANALPAKRRLPSLTMSSTLPGGGGSGGEMGTALPLGASKLPQAPQPQRPLPPLAHIESATFPAQKPPLLPQGASGRVSLDLDPERDPEREHDRDRERSISHSSHTGTAAYSQVTEMESPGLVALNASGSGSGGNGSGGNGTGPSQSPPSAGGMRSSGGGRSNGGGGGGGVQSRLSATGASPSPSWGARNPARRSLGTSIGTSSIASSTVLLSTSLATASSAAAANGGASGAGGLMSGRATSNSSAS